MGLLDRILSEFDQAGKPKDRPLVTLSYAQSLDGSIAARRGRPLQISGTESAILTHQLRANHDSILVGVGTVLADDPQLTVRLVDGDDPQPVILDSTLRTPLNSALVSAGTPWIATTNRADPEKVEAFASLDVRLLHLPASNNGQVDLQGLLECLHQMGARSLMVEGGAGVISSFINSQLVDYMILTISPMIVGGLSAVQMPQDYLKQKINEFPRLSGVLNEYFGDDLIIFGRLEWLENMGI
jgi:GTP cyclohydrolase II